MKVRYTPTKGTLGNLVESPSDGCTAIASPLSLHAGLATMSCVLRFEAFGRPWLTQVRPARCSLLCSGHPVLALWLNKEHSGFVVNHYKPRGLGATSMPIPLMTRPPWSSWLSLSFVAQPRNRLRLCLALLAIMRLALDPVGHRVPRTKPTCLSRPWKLHTHRPFALVVHPYQRKSNCNLHLQYYSKSQSTPHCQSLIVKERPSAGPRTHTGPQPT
jgi:hypothetical protein